jgi:hypothetical protein
VVYAIGFKLTAAPWFELIAVFTLAAAVTALVRGHARELHPPALHMRGVEIAAFVAAAVLLAMAAVIGFKPLAPPSRTQGTAGLWLLEAPRGAPAVCVRVINEQFHVTSYRVLVTVAGRPNNAFGPIKLAPGASWYRLVPVGPGRPTVHATLYRATAPASAYRNTSITSWQPSLRATHC